VEGAIGMKRTREMLQIDRGGTIERERDRETKTKW
jgi:hypothetical protein